MSDTEGSATTPARPPIAVRPADDPTYDADPGKGWVLFAGIMLSVVGLLNLVYGIAAVGNSNFYVREVEYVLADLKTWGWFLTIIGVAQLAAAVGVFMAAEWARWVGILFAAANMVIQFLALPGHPTWALMVFMVDVIIIYGLVTYGGRDRHSLAG